MRHYSIEAPFFTEKIKILAEKIKILSEKIQILAEKNLTLAAKISPPASDPSIFSTRRSPEGAPKSSKIIEPELIKFATSHRRLVTDAPTYMFHTSTYADTPEKTPFCTKHKVTFRISAQKKEKM